jgi:tetratricopeptide (TPR) repeat protein
VSRPLSDRRRDLERWLYYFNLADWWLQTFTDDETTRVARYFLNVYPSNAVLEDYEPAITDQTPVGFLLSLNFGPLPEMYDICARCLDKVASLTTDPKMLHKVLSSRIAMTYRRRADDPSALEQTIKLCEQQIRLAPEAKARFLAEGPPLVIHPGYKQLAIIRERQGRFEEAMRLAEAALAEGWQGDWETRIDRLKKKIGGGNLSHSQ